MLVFVNLRSIFLHVVFTLLVGLMGHPPSLSQESTALPNVIIILADDLGIGDVSAYNQDAAFRTPNIDRLAEDGMSFMDAHTSAAICTPTRYGIMTGRYNWRSRLKHGGFNGYSQPLIDRDRMTIAELFRDNGYHTAMVGKWHLGWDWRIVEGDDTSSQVPNIDFSQRINNGPEDHGFTYSFALAASLSSPPYVYVENSRPTSIPKSTSVNYDEKAFWRKGPLGTDFRHVEVLNKLTNKSVAYLEERAKEERPFFLYFALTAPHAPIIPTTEFIGRSNTNAYGDFVVMVDHVVGQIMRALAENDLEDNTLLIFTSDNGQSPRADFDDDELPLANHRGSYIYRGKKFDIYEGGHRVPFITRWPDQIEAASISNEIISTVDLMATSADLLGVDLPDEVAEDSYSILPVWINRAYSKPLREATVMHSSDGRFAIRKGNWKLILWPGSGGWTYPMTTEEMRGLPKFQLYHLGMDPGETQNLYGEHPGVVTDLKILLEDYIINGRSTPGQPQKNDGPGYWEELTWMK